MNVMNKKKTWLDFKNAVDKKLLDNDLPSDTPIIYFDYSGGYQSNNPFITITKDGELIVEDRPFRY